MGYSKKILRVLLTIGIVPAFTVLADADESEPSWASTLNAGLTWTDGNSDSLRLNVGWLWEGEKPTLGAMRAGVTGNYGKSRPDPDDEGRRASRETDVENVRAFLQAQRDLSARTYASFNLSAFYDGQALVDYRFIIGPGLGAKIYNRHDVRVKIEIGPSYLIEKVDGVRDDYPVVRLAERLDWRISETARLWQEVEYLPTADDFSDYLLLSEVGIDVAINKRFSWQTTLQSAYDASPAEDRERHDLSLVASLAYRL